VKCTLRSPVEGKRSLELVYRVGDLRWESYYQVLVRGAEEEKLSVDFSGRVRIENRTSRSFSNALLRLIGPGTVREPEAAPDPGFLILAEDSPLADKWRPQPADPEPQYVYRVPRRVNLAGGTEMEVALVSATRTPAKPRYTMSSDAIPLSAKGQGRPLKKSIVFQNSSAHGLGWVLPPGPVDVFLGGMRQYVLPGARIPYTPINGEIRIDMGQSPEVVGFRRSVKQTDVVDGSYEQVYELVLENQGGTPVVVEVVEKPPPVLEWNVISANASYTERSQRLHFKPTVKAKNERRIQYTIRVRQPSL
jgi:hypothetical protein